VPHLAPYARKSPTSKFIIDIAASPSMRNAARPSLDDTIALAEHQNVALKWAHAPAFLSTAAYPSPTWKPSSPRALDAFGRERILWASDYNVSRHRQNWAESLFSIRHSPTLSDTDKEWILAARSNGHCWNWPAPENALRPQADASASVGGV